MKAIIALLFVGVALASFTEQQYQDAFTNWMQANGRSYEHDSFQYRYRIFRKNLDFITAFNANNTKMQVGMNKFGDLTAAEFSKYYKGLNMNGVVLPGVSAEKATFTGPANVDWRTQGAVTPIKNQGQCGSCWSFSTTGSVEGCHFINRKQLNSLSEQNLMDCSWSQGNQGCDGGLMTQAMTYIISNKGIDTESSYPYTAESSQTCLYQASNSGSTETSFTNVNQGDEADLANKIVMGPTSVAIDASQSSFQFYTSGIYSDPNCSSTQLDHGVLAVGYAPTYYIVKNSWGTDWGQQGYIWMARNDNNMCGIATMATLPTGC